MSQDPRIGSELAGYRIEGLLGRGGMSVVYLATHQRLGRKVALKLLTPELSEDQRFRERFVKESQLAASLDHPNIIPIYDADETDGLLYIAMRYVPGTDLKSLIVELGRLDPERTVSIVEQTASALDAAHARGLVHRDVKPSNILMAPARSSATGDHIYLSDFGLTKRASSDSGITATGQFVGTLDYAAPEQFEGKPLGPQTDVYSLGCLLFQCLTGEVPFPRDNEAALVYAHLYAPPPTVTGSRPELPSGLDAVVARAMRKAPSDRYATCGQLAAAAEAAIGTTRTRDGRTTPDATGIRQRRRRLLVPVAVLVAALVALASFLVVRSRSRPGAPALAPVTVDAIAEIDQGKSVLVKVVPLGSSPTRVAVGGGAVWVLNGPQATLSRLDPLTGAVSTVGLGTEERQGPWGVSFDQGSVWAQVGRVMFRLNPETASDIGTLGLDRPRGAAAVGEGAVWYACRTDQTLRRVDPQSGEDRTILQLPVTPEAVVAAGTGAAWVWVGGSGVPENLLLRVDPASGRLVGQITLPSGSVAIALSTKAVWLANAASGTVTRIDPDTDSVSAVMRIGGHPGAIAADASSVWVADPLRGTVIRIDATRNRVASTIQVGRGITGIAIGEGRVWVTVDAA